MLESLRLVNFKSWKDTGDIQLAPITAFFGTNSSGKTSLLQALLLLKQTIASSNSNITLDFGQQDALFVELGSFKETIFNHDETLPLEFNLSWKLLNEHYIIPLDFRSGKNLFTNNKIGFKTQIKKNNGDKPAVEFFSYEFDSTNFALKKDHIDKLFYKLNIDDHDLNFIPLTPETNTQYVLPIKFYGYPSYINFVSEYTDFVDIRLLGALPFKLEELFSRINYLGPLRDYPKRQYYWTNDSQSLDVGTKGERAIQTILSSNNFEAKDSLSEKVAYWLKELGLIHSFEIKSLSAGSNIYQVHVKISEKSSEVLLTDVGFGVSQIIPVITLCYCVPEGSILLIEQPEIHLHPKIQAGLADVFIDAIKTRGIQIILESHSEHLLRRLQRRMAEFGLNDSSVDKEKINLYFCESKDGASEIKNLILDDYGNITNYPKNFFGDDFGEMAAMAKARIERIKKSKQMSDNL